MMVACQNGKKNNTPEEVTESFLKAFYTADFTHMYQVTTKKSQVVIKVLQEGMKDRPEQLEMMRKRKIEFTDTKKAYVIYTKNETDENGNVTVYAASILKSENGDTKLGGIDTDEEWSRIKEILKSLSKDE